MITLREPNFSVAIHKKEVESTYLNFGGIYKLFGVDNNLIYIGKAKNLRSRLSSHLKGKSNSEGFYKEIEYITYASVESAAQREILETYYINLLKPRYNLAKTYYDMDLNFSVDTGIEEFAEFVIKLVKANRNLRIGIPTLRHLCKTQGVHFVSIFNDYVQTRLSENKIKFDKNALILDE